MKVKNTTIDELAPIKRKPKEAKEVFKKVFELEMSHLHREGPDLEQDVINIVKSIVK